MKIKYLFIIPMTLWAFNFSFAYAQDQQIMTPVNADDAQSAGPKETLEKSLSLKMYEVGTGDISQCANDQTCISGVTSIKTWICAADDCHGSGQGKNVVNCVGGALSQKPKDVQEQIGTTFCAYLDSPSTFTRQALLNRIDEGSKEDKVVEFTAYYMALKQSAENCQNYIKDYIGPWGTQWKFKWFRALAGCRILAHQRTAAQEISDFNAWMAKSQGTGSCEGITDTDMRRACNAPGVVLDLSSESNGS